MRLNRRNFFLLALGGSAFALPAAIPQANRRSNTPKATPKAKFEIYDALVYKNKPSLDLPLIGTNGGEYWKDSRRETPDEAACRGFARYIMQGTKRIVIDIEHWNYDIRKAPEAEVKETMRKVIQIVDWMKNETPAITIGMYPFPPITDYWTPVANPLGIGAWQKANEFLHPISERVDFIAPEIYAYYDDRDGWLKFATANLAESLKFGKKVVPIVWPRYHVSNDKLKYQMLPGDYWQLQLKTVRESGVDGLILWDWEPDTTLDPSWDWWQETIKFVKVNA
ncbi:MAG: hypothetical protein KME10_10755 [Plectolyngbya sp. WJT66-NPBG17]|jgi:hypothetical protein|nr:hypothetical protein [Plectolyngbya sp. WJT66-NPBG17]